MVDLQSDSKMEGWLYLIRSNRIGLQYSRKRYFVLQDSLLKSFKTRPANDDEEPIRSAVIDSCIRATDNGRECIQRKVLFIFSLYNTSNHNDHLKLGASSSEEAARWIRSFQDAAAKERPSPAANYVACSKRRWPYFGNNRMCVPPRKYHDRKLSIDWTVRSSMHTEAITADVIAPSPWKIFGCQNGLRLFKEAKDWDSKGRHWEWDDHPAIMAVGVVDGASEAIFRTLMSLGPSRSEWDFCYYRGSVVEHIDGHTDIIHEQLESDWLPWGMKKRDFLCQRYWRREEDGTYVILYHSVFHNKCRSVRGYVRACLKSGGYVITPINHGKQSLVKHMLSVNWKSWKLYVRPASARAITIRMLEKIAALREMFRSKGTGGTFSSSVEDSSMRDIVQDESSEHEDVNKMELVEEEKELLDDPKPVSRSSSLIGMQDAAPDEFFDVPEPTDYDHSLEIDEWSSQHQSFSNNNMQQVRFTSGAAGLVKKLHDLAVQKKGYMDLQELSREEENAVCCYGATLQTDSTCSAPCTWAMADPCSFLIRGPNYLEDNNKIKATGTLMQMVGADWLRSDKREDNLAGRPNSIVQQAADRGGSEFFFIVNIQVPGTTTYNLALYYMMRTPLEENPLLHRFVNEDDAFRNSRFKLIPYISKGSWIVKQSVGKKACLVGQALEINYFRGNNYLEIDVDVGSSTVARGVVSLVLGYLNNLVIEMAFVVQANTAEELPEYLLGTCRLNQLDVLKTVAVEQ